MKKARQVTACSVTLALVGLFVTSCARSERATAPLTGEPWARNLGELPPQRTSADDEVSRAKADLTAARERAQR